MTQETSENVLLSDALTAHATTHSDQTAFTFLDFPSRRKGWVEHSISYRELDQKARQIAQILQRDAKPGDRAVLLFPAGTDFICAFMACAYSGLIAVPSPVPKVQSNNERIDGIVQDSEATIVLTIASVRESCREISGWFQTLKWIALDEQTEAVAADFVPSKTSSNDVALLQYSSGSTGSPKGVMISHGNLASQARLFSDSVELVADETFVSWLPAFHDMGLVLPIVTALYQRYHSILMAPESFIIKPERWLQAMDHFAAGHTVAPDFAYDLCVRMIPDAVLDSLDLKAVRYAGNSSEPVRESTISAFSERFARCGFKPEAMWPAYGLAEATLMVTGSKHGATVKYYDRNGISRDKAIVVEAGHKRARPLVSSGVSYGSTEVLLVDPEKFTVVDDRRVGELWVHGDSVGLGYWNKEEETRESFQAKIAGAEDGKSYLRTGDLGFFEGEQIYICGRVKDLIVIRGANHHAPDIEATVVKSHPMLDPISSAAFSIDVDDKESLVIVQQLTRKSGVVDPETLKEISQNIRDAISQKHQIAVHAVVLMKRGVPKTTSGKVRRLECRRRYLNRSLSAYFQWENTGEVSTSASTAKLAGDSAHPKTNDLANWLCTTIETTSGRPKDSLKPASRILDLRLTPDQMLGVMRALEKDFNVIQPIMLFNESETIQSMAEFIAYLPGGSFDDAPATGGRLSVDQLIKLKSNKAQQTDREREPIAIVGMSCRFPGAGGVEDYWNNLCEGTESVTDIPGSRWDIESTYDKNPLAMGKMSTYRGGFIDGVEEFDRKFFQVPIREAVRIDPAHRLLMEVCWETFEDAGIVPETAAESQTGVFIGISGSDYAQLQFGDEALADAYAGVGSALTNAAGRISHFLNLRGPAIAVDTACSASLTAIHLACMSLRSGECEMALAGGVNIILSPLVTMSLSKAGMMAPDGRCKAFDSRADGYVRSEGVGLTLLKPLSKALADGDPIYGVVKGSASNQDGRSSGIAAPNGAAQQRVVLAACDDAGVVPGSLDYIEAHGTGTAIGDPIEVNALGEVLKIGAKEGTECPIGSVKTNIGHSESAAGIASFIKASMILDRKKLPPSLNYEEANPLIPFHDYRIHVQTELSEIKRNHEKARLGVNGFGISGTNVHLVLEEHDPASQSGKPAASEADAPIDRMFALPITAATKEALKNQARVLAGYIESNSDDASLRNLHRTLAYHRGKLPHRLVVVGKSASDFIEVLGAFANGAHHDDAIYRHHIADSNSEPKLAFLYAGQGSQWWAMGRDLYATEPVYREELEKIDKTLSQYTQWSLIEELGRDENDTRLDETAFAQPAIFGLQVAITKVFQYWGIEPKAVAGHSVGEVTAAYVSGALDLDSACKLIAVRARLMQESTGEGRMASVDLELDAIGPYLTKYKGDVEVAAINGPGSVIVSGTTGAITQLITDLEESGVSALPLPVNYAFHSRQMEPFRERLVEELKDITPLEASIRMLSTVTADWVEGQQLNSKHWGRNMRNRVEFRAGVSQLAADGFDTFLEIGGTPVLSGNIQRILQTDDRSGQVITSLRKETDDQKSLLLSFGSLFCAGVYGEWENVLEGGAFDRSVPRYAWDRQRFWLDGPHQEARSRMCSHPLLSIRMPTALPTWQSRLDRKVSRYLEGPFKNGYGSVSNGLFMEIACGAMDQLNPDFKHIELRDIEYDKIAQIPKGGDIPVFQSTLNMSDDTVGSFQVFVQYDESQGKATNWEPVFSARQVIASGGSGYVQPSIDIDGAVERAEENGVAADIYASIEGIGVSYDDSIRIAKEVWVGDGMALVSLRENLTEETDSDTFRVHPLYFEALEQACCFAIGSEAFTYEVSSLQSLQVWESDEAPAYVYARRHREKEVGQVENCAALVDVWLTDQEGKILIAASQVLFKTTGSEAATDFTIPDDPSQWLFDIEWVPSFLEVDSEKFDATKLGLIVLADRGGAGDLLAKIARERGHMCRVAHIGDEYQQLSDNEFVVRQNSSDDLLKLIMASFKNPVKDLDSIVHMWNLDSTGVVDATAQTISDDQSLGVISAVKVVHAFAQSEGAAHGRLWMVTGGSQPIVDSPSELQVMQAPVWGLGKSLAIEHPELQCVRIDLSANPTEDEVRMLCDELQANGYSDQVGFRAGERYEPRLINHYAEAFDEVPETDEDEDSDEVVAELSRDESIDRLLNNGAAYELFVTDTEAEADVTAEKYPRSSPGWGEVEIRIEQAVLGQLFDKETDQTGARIHLEQCSGVVTAVGVGVSEYAFGDRVAGIYSGSLSSHVVVSSDRLSKLESGKNEAALTTSLKPYAEAYLALYKMARLQKGMSVLIHGAANQYGRAAISVARKLGAIVYATAHGSEDRKVLSRLRVEHALEMGSPNLIADVQELTDGRGVDVVVNCGDVLQMDRADAVLASFGCCIELSVSRNAPGNLGSDSRSNAFHYSTDIEDLLVNDSVGGKSVVSEVATWIRDGSLKALPSTAVSIDGLGAVDFSDDSTSVLLDLPVATRENTDPPALTFDDNGTYLITGGLGGLGLSIVERMALRGAKYIVLTGRRSPSLNALDMIAQLEEQGTRCEVMLADVSDEDQLEGLLKKIDEELPPLKGIIHAAGVLDNALVVNLDESRIRRVMKAKVEGAWHLHKLTARYDLDMFIMFSSLAALIGSHGQTNYSAANAFLDALADHRSRLGLPGISIAWGPWSEVGMASGAHNVRRLQEIGLGVIEPEKGLSLLETVMREQLSGTIGAIPMNWALWARYFPYVSKLPFFSRLIAQEESVIGGARITSRSLMGMDVQTQQEEVQTAIQEAVCQSLKLDLSDVPIDAPLTAIGLDSIISLEVKSRIEAGIDVVIMTNSLLKGGSIKDLTKLCLTQLLTDENSDAAADGDSSELTADSEHVNEELVEGIDEMSQEEIEELLSELSTDQAEVSSME